MIRRLLLVAVLTCSGTAHAQTFAPSHVGPGVIRSWGDDQMAGVLTAWQQAFRRYHPDITFTQSLYGSGAGMAGIITGTSDLSLMGRPVTANEVIGFEWVFRYKPLQIQVLTGDLQQDEHSPALAVFVSSQNPLRSISKQQLIEILGCPGMPSGATTWASAGVTGPWASRPIHAYIPDEETGTGAFLQQTLLGLGDRWNWSLVREFHDTPNQPWGAQTIAALRQDPNGLAISTLIHAASGAKLLQIDGLSPSRETLVSARYPLTRGV